MKVIDLFKKQPVLTVALIAAAVTCFFVPPDAQYLGYFDFKTLACLFCTLAAVGGFARIHTFRILSRKIVRRLSNTRNVITAIVFITYFGSMLLANDMALLTFLPLGYFVLTAPNKQKFMAYTFILQTIAANLGGMITPFGNPQNLFLYNYFQITNAEFFSIMWFPTAVSVVLLAICCLFIKSERFDGDLSSTEKLNVKRAVVFFVLFAYAIVIVFRVVPYWTGLFMMPIIFLLDRKAILKVDYVLLLTFCMFFTFAGNLVRIPAVNEFFSNLLRKNTLLTGVLSCQVISNVPSAILLSKFTADYAHLLVAVNIGGCGTLIS